jgi:hypothetical protein
MNSTYSSNQAKHDGLHRGGIALSKTLKTLRFRSRAEASGCPGSHTRSAYQRPYSTSRVAAYGGVMQKMNEMVHGTHMTGIGQRDALLEPPYDENNKQSCIFPFLFLQRDTPLNLVEAEMLSANQTNGRQKPAKVQGLSITQLKTRARV